MPSRFSHISAALEAPALQLQPVQPQLDPVECFEDPIRHWFNNNKIECPAPSHGQPKTVHTPSA